MPLIPDLLKGVFHPTLAAHQDTPESSKTFKQSASEMWLSLETAQAVIGSNGPLGFSPTNLRLLCQPYSLVTADINTGHIHLELFWCCWQLNQKKKKLKYKSVLAPSVDRATWTRWSIIPPHENVKKKKKMLVTKLSGTKSQMDFFLN